MDNLDFNHFLNRYSNESTDKLLYLKARGGLSTDAEEALEQVLSERDITDEQKSYAKETVLYLKGEIENTRVKNRSVKKKCINCGELDLFYEDDGMPDALTCNPIRCKNCGTKMEFSFLERIVFGLIGSTLFFTHIFLSKEVIFGFILSLEIALTILTMHFMLYFLFKHYLPLQNFSEKNQLRWFLNHGLAFSWLVYFVLLFFIPQ